MPLSDATAARKLSREMRNEVDETLRAWGIRATAKMRWPANRSSNWREREAVLDCGPLAVWALGGSHEHRLVCLGLKWQAQLVAWEEQGVEIGDSFWFGEGCEDSSLLLVAVRVRRPVGRGADGRVEWEYMLGEEEFVKVVKDAQERAADVDWPWLNTWPWRPLLSQCAMRGCLGAVKACLDVEADVDADSPVSLCPTMDCDIPNQRRRDSSRLAGAGRTSWPRGGSGGAAGGGGVGSDRVA